MRRNIYAVLVITFCFFAGNNGLNGQDIHYSQFYNSPLNINPALTGIFNGDIRVIGSLRDQWRQIPVPYTTFSGNYDQKIYTKNRDKGFFGVGAIFNYDRAGDANYNTSGLNLTGSYSYIINRSNIITGGLLLGVTSEGFDESGLTWDNYWNGLNIDPGKGTGENFDRNRVTYLESGVGLNYRFQKSARTFLNLGAGAWHLLPPGIDFLDGGDQDLPMKFAFNAEGLFKVADPIDIQLHGNYAFQGPYNVLLLGGLARIHINQKPGKKFALDLGASFRTSGSIIPTLALHYNQWYVGASYDINTTPFVNDHNLRRGGPEVHVRYIITNVKPLSEKKACPIY